MPADLPLSIVVIAAHCRRRGSLCLESLLSQSGIELAEILLVDTAGTKAAPLVGACTSRVRMLAGATGETYGGIRAECARQAGCRLIPFIEEHCFALPGWVEAALRHLDGEWAAIGGAMPVGGLSGR